MDVKELKSNCISFLFACILAGCIILLAMYNCKKEISQNKDPNTREEISFALFVERE